MIRIERMTLRLAGGGGDPHAAARAAAADIARTLSATASRGRIDRLRVTAAPGSDLGEAAAAALRAHEERGER